MARRVFVGFEAVSAVVPGEGFEAPGYLRISFARSLPELEAGGRRIANFLGHLRKV